MESYSQLKTDLKNHMARQDFTDAELDNFIVRATARVNRKLRIGGMETESDITVDAQTVDLPADFRGARALYLDDDEGGDLRYVTPEVMPEFDNGDTGKPRVFTIRKGKIKFDRSPDQTYTAKLHYYQKFAPLSDSVTTNWLTDEAPDVLFYGALVYAWQFVRDLDQMKLAQAYFDEALAELEEADKKDSFGPAPVMRTEGAYP